ncbi:MAG: hypothetical protein ACE145_08340 [Terriglobia bacterium]
MRRPSPSVEAQIRHAFGLLLEIRNQPEAPSLLAKAIAFLKMLMEGGSRQAPPIVISVQAVRIRDL